MPAKKKPETPAQEAQNAAGMCPSCGACQHCGHRPAPYYPVVYYPRMRSVVPTPWWQYQTTCGTGSASSASGGQYMQTWNGTSWSA